MSPLLEPSKVAPLEVDLRRVFWAAIGLWIVALLVVGGLALAGVDTGRGAWICAVGIALGLLALACGSSADADGDQRAGSVLAGQVQQRVRPARPTGQDLRQAVPVRASPRPPRALRPARRPSRAARRRRTHQVTACPSTASRS